MQRELQGIAPQWLQGWGAAEVLQHTLPPPQMGWYPVGRGRGEPTPYKRGAQPLSLVVLHHHGCYPYYGMLCIPCGYPPWGIGKAYWVPTPYAIACMAACSPLYSLHHWGIPQGTLLVVCHVERVWCLTASLDGMQRERIV